MMKLMIQNGAAILHQFVSCKRPGKMSSYQAEQHLVVSKKVNLDISVTLPIVCLKILPFVLIVLWKTNIKTANWRADFECYFCLWQGPAYKTTLTALTRPHSIPARGR
ncbi:hypothetical protein R3I93_008674 [Phoxinus phoxinus]|uniref:Uncharacterized protein n=1 Tax=Phoxinus phoxinus TaxID=58324 RepID=A0AAN9H9V0_9TELE